MGDRTPHGPAMRGAVKTGGGATLDRDPGFTVVGITPEAIAMEGDPVAAEGIIRPLLLHALSGDRMNPDRLVDLLHHPEATGGGLPAGHTDSHGEGAAQTAVLEEQQPTATAQHHDVTLLFLQQIRRQ